MLDWGWDPTAAVVWVALLGNWFINLSTYTSDHAVIQRYLSTRDEKQAARAMWGNTIFVVPWGLLVFVLGTALYTFYRSHPELMEIGSKTDAIVPLFMAHQMPPGITGLVIAAVFAATMSTVDSGIHSMSTALVSDFYERWKPNSADQHRLVLARVLTVLLGAFATGAALIMATYNIQSLWDLFLKLIGLLGSGLAGLFVLGIFYAAGECVWLAGRSGGQYRRAVLCTELYHRPFLPLLRHRLGNRCHGRLPGKPARARR